MGKAIAPPVTLVSHLPDRSQLVESLGVGGFVRLPMLH